MGYYILEWKRDNSDWITVPQVASCSYDITSAYSGTYQFRIRATNAVGVKSPWRASAAVTIDGLLAAPASPVSLTAAGEVFGIGLKWGFPSGLNILSYTEIWYSQTNDRTAATLLTMLPYPRSDFTLTGLKSGQKFYFWARLVDKNGLAGDYYPASATGGVVGTSSTDANSILGYLTNQITSSQLGSDLLSEINTASSTASSASEAAAKAQTAITSEAETRAAADSAISTEVSSVSSAVSSMGRAADAEGDLADVLNEWSSRASITQIQKTSSSNEEALAELDTKLSAKINQNSADIETNATAIAKADGTLSSAYTVKTGITAGGKYYAAGFAVGVDNSSGSVQSQFLVNADTFAILNSTESGGTVTSPFAVSGGSVYLSSAFIKDASISNAKIDTAAVTTLKIGERSVTNPQSIKGGTYTGLSTSTSSYTDLMSFTITATGGNILLVLGLKADVISMDGKGGVFYWRLMRGSTLVLSSFLIVSGSSTMLSPGASQDNRTIIDFPDAGSVTYTIQYMSFEEDSSFSLSNTKIYEPYIASIEFKR